jgi:hypothetical protein
MEGWVGEREEVRGKFPCMKFKTTVMRQNVEPAQPNSCTSAGERILPSTFSYSARLL